MERISQHISLREGIKSNTATKQGIDNTPNKIQLAAMQEVADNVFEPVRLHYGVPIAISSFFRCGKLNSAIGGSSTSQHMKGEAIDMDADTYGGITNADIFHYIKDNLVFDQMIWEFGTKDNPNWIHVSYSAKKQNRRKLTIAYKDKHGKTRYKNWDRG